MLLTTPVYVVKILFKFLHLADFLDLPVTEPVYVRRLLHLALICLPAFSHCLDFTVASVVKNWRIEDSLLRW